MYSTWTILQLKEELRKRKAATTGKKGDLILRLAAYDETFRNAAQSGDNADNQMITPPGELYKDINADTALPPLTKHLIQMFTERFLKKTSNALQLYESRHLLTARAATINNHTYIKTQCKASMKKVLYVVDVKLRNGCGSIEETHCECAAGSGTEAHCKHVLATLFGVEHMVRAKCMLLHQVCTQRLMTFKQPTKLFHASPIKCEDLLRKRKRANINYDPIKNADIPVGYTDFVRNLIINFGDTSAPIKQTFYPANTYAVEWDHSFYLGKSGEEYTLERLYLQNVPISKIMAIEESTREQKQCRFWKELHETHICASIYHTICHSKDSTKQHLAEKIICPIEFSSKATVHGNVNEPYAIAKFEDMYCVEVRKRTPS